MFPPTRSKMYNIKLRGIVWLKTVRVHRNEKSLGTKQEAVEGEGITFCVVWTLR